MKRIQALQLYSKGVVEYIGFSAFKLVIWHPFSFSIILGAVSDAENKRGINAPIYLKI
jgi:hypothetical protein